ncbi:MAG: hypothetical protein RBR02_06465 [Desulfuromonadaceae bacterium]|nr:hypothetical protein [Desulfuromonadaceae bacterium]
MDEGIIRRPILAGIIIYLKTHNIITEKEIQDHIGALKLIYEENEKYGNILNYHDILKSSVRYGGNSDINKR